MTQSNSPTVGEYMTEIPATIETGLSLADALDRMFSSNIRHLPVVSERGTLVGMLSTRDIAGAGALRGLDLKRTKVDQVMSPMPFSCSTETPLLLVIEEMERDRLGSAVITRDGKPCGIFTTTDALRALRAVLTGAPVEPLVEPTLGGEEAEGGEGERQGPRPRMHVRGPSQYDGMVSWFLAKLV